MKLWIITSSYNDYDQHGDYFVAAFTKKPTVVAIVNTLQCTNAFAEHVFIGGGRQTDEDKWYNLEEVDEGANNAPEE